MGLLRVAQRAFGVILLCLLAAPSWATPSACSGDCDLDGAVTVDELVRGVNIGLGIVPFDDCPQFDRDGSETVSVDEIITAVQNALNGCTAGPTPTPTTPPSATFVIRGKVIQAAGGGGGTSPAAGAQIEATIDRDGNGQVAAGESYLGTADEEGNYVLNVGVAEGDRVVVGFRTADSAPLFRTLDAAPGADVTVNVTLRTVDDLDCEAGRCSLRGDRLTIEGLPAGVTGNAQVFNPVVQPDAFPGDFADADGNLLLSGVFSSVELTNDLGQPVKDLPAPATLRMQIPRETWSIITDIMPGNDRIDVPLYAFDEVAGTWVRDGAAVLENDQRGLISEASLGAIRSGAFSGNVIARGEVQHFSYWNIDWPISAHGCISGTLLDDAGQPARGASVIVRGLSYVGSSTTSTDNDGHFCADVLRSEGPGEDVDQDGVTGETQRVIVRVAYNGRTYDAGGLDVPVQSATCDSGCANFGEVMLTAALELHPAVCSFTMNVRDRTGAPVAGAFVVAADGTVDPDVAADLCGEPVQFCLSSGVTDGNGNLNLTTVVLDTLFGVALSTTQDGGSTLQRFGEVTYSNGCPTAPLLLTLTEGFRLVALNAQFTPPGRIDWTPAIYPATTVAVSGGAGPKWLVASAPPGFGPPVTYGTVPAGAFQIIPVAGAPAPVVSGDFIIITFTAPGDDGYPIVGQGFVFVP